MKLEEPQLLSVGKHSPRLFEKGHYFYVGKAQNGLKGRISRHLRTNKKRHWHIDYFQEKAPISEVWIKAGFFDECRTARKIQSLLRDASVPFKQFGSSDCRCPGHLLYSGRETPDLSRLRNRLSFRKVNIHGHHA
jgi:Uri superfamily endonuclease